VRLCGRPWRTSVRLVSRRDGAAGGPPFRRSVCPWSEEQLEELLGLPRVALTLLGGGGQAACAACRSVSYSMSESSESILSSAVVVLLYPRHDREA
jgi:hypothetical protein